MINEILEVQNYLEGKQINEKSLYRTCYMIAKWYAGQGMSHLEIRERLFDWGKANNIYIDCNLNHIINQVMTDKRALRGETTIKISDEDVTEINKRFDKKNCRLLALAILSYAKCAADDTGTFPISLSALSDWIGIAAPNISNRYLPELVNYGFVEKVTEPKQTFSWNKTAKSKHIRLKMMVPVHNTGTYQLTDNDIMQTYDIIWGRK